ncbi:MAG: O-acetyl-ADP-ribose deacetylase [Vulcanimicrobiaceae bacterium]
MQYETAIGASWLRLIQADITTLRADAIVNAANAALAGGGGVDGAIHRAGGPSIMEACRRIGGCAPGSAVITPAGNLHAQYVIHAVAPIYRGSSQDALTLRRAYESALRLAREHRIESIAFPSLGTGAYGYPIEEAARIALATVLARMRETPALREVVFALFSARDRDEYAAALRELLV